MIHIISHFLVPALVSLFIDLNPNANLKRIALMLCGLAIDLDHFLATPIYDSERCSIGFHPLHHPYMAILYLALAFPRKSRWLGIGLVLHLLLDTLDCLV